MPAPAIDVAPATVVTMGGRPLPDGDPGACLEAARDVSRAWLEQPLTVVIAGTRVERTRQQLGARVDAAHLQTLVAARLDATSPLRREHARAHGSAPLALPVPWTLDAAAALGAL